MFRWQTASVLINELMEGLMACVRQSDILKLRLYTAAFHTTLSGEAMVKTKGLYCDQTIACVCLHRSLSCITNFWMMHGGKQQLSYLLI